MKKQHHNKQPNTLTESLRSNDLKDFVGEFFSIDQYSSKMGEDRDVVVLGFRVREKNPAIDLMEFIEKGYPFVLDADISSGEEHDGQYQVFVELERTKQLPGQIKNLLDGISRLTDNFEWQFRYQKSGPTMIFNEESISENVPMTQEEYDSKMLEIKNVDVKEFFDQGIADVTLESDNTITFKKPYAGDIQAKFVAIGDYEDVKGTVPGKLSLDENSQSQMFFLNKYLGNYDINKIGDKFLIRNGSKAVVIEKGRW
jgi:hypothetical protein